MTMNTQEVAERLCQHCRDGTEERGIEELYSQDIVSVEPMAGPGRDPVSKGVDALKEKHTWWAENYEVHGTGVEGPFINGDKFSVIFDIDVSERASGQRWRAKEIALYEVEDGKIVRESFFMAPMA